MGTTVNAGYSTKKINNLRVRSGWCMDINVDKPFEEMAQFAMLMTQDREGNISETCGMLPHVKANAMKELDKFLDLSILFGFNITNEQMQEDLFIDKDFSGGEGIIDSISNAGNVMNYDASDGLSVHNLLRQLCMANISRKSSNEYLLLASPNLVMGIDDKLVRDETAKYPYTAYNTFTRGGTDNSVLDFAKTSKYTMGGKTIMVKTVDEFQKIKSIGHGSMQHFGILMAMDGLKDSSGRTIPPVEFFDIKGSGCQSSWELMREWEVDGRTQKEACEEIQGHMIKQLSWMVHCPDRHFVLQGHAC